MTSDNNKDMVDLIKAIGDTPGFRLASANSGNFKAVRTMLEHAGHVVSEETKTLSIRSKNSSFKDTVADLKHKLGWSQELHDELQEIVRSHRVAETDCTLAVTERLMDAFVPGWNKEPEPEVEETPEQRRERVRHARMLGGTGSAKSKAGQAVGGSTSAPPQVIHEAGAIRAERVSPERALDLLVTIADYQRKLKPAKVAEFMRKMKEGEWKLLASDPICIDVNGKLCNGQHRLEAVYQLEKGQDFYVAYDVDPDTYDVMDRGTRRTTADMLFGQARRDGTSRPDVSAAPLASLLKMLYLWENIPQEGWAGEQRHVQEHQVMDAHKAHPNAEDSVAHGRLTRLKIRPTSAMFAHYMIAHAHDFDPEVVKILDAWYEELRTPRRIRPGDPAFALREWFLGGEMDRVANRKSLPTKFHEQLLQTYLILRCWDNTTIGKSMMRLSWKPDFQITTAARVTDRISFPPSS
jgi:hypothetical protein